MDPMRAQREWRLSMNHWNHRQVLDCGDGVCAAAALDLKLARPSSVETLESSCAKALARKIRVQVRKARHDTARLV
jgi:hypothetical protein